MTVLWNFRKHIESLPLIVFVQLQKFIGCIPRFLFEQPAKILWILKAEFVSDFANWFIDIKYTFFNFLYQLGLYAFQYSFPGFLFDQITEIIQEKMEFFYKNPIQKGGQSLWFIGFETYYIRTNMAF